MALLLLLQLSACGYAIHDKRTRSRLTGWLCAARTHTMYYVHLLP